MANPIPDSAASRFSPGMASPRSVRSRAQSLSSDRPSTIGLGLTSPPMTVSPEAAFIAASAASQIVTNDQDSHADAWYDEHGLEPAGETALVSQAALQLVNNFLDQLLFNFLQVSRATTLAALRPAVTEVLKPKLAKDAINNADEELREYLGGADEDDYIQPQGPNNSRDWDHELVWKRTRLRCMVYSSLGDMEEEDEDMYMEQENLEIGADELVSDVISPAVAIFLTSVLEYMGELTLTVAGQAAYHRMRVKFEKDLKEGARDREDLADRIVVEELDMERVALDRTLGRLWRGWKKRIRTPAIDLVGRPYSRSSNGHARQGSNATEVLSPKPVVIEDVQDAKKHPDDTIEEDVEEPKEILPADVPLPEGENDIEEIEVPGLAFVYSDIEDEEETDDEQPSTSRPKSLFIFPSLLPHGLPTPIMSQPSSPVIVSRKRSSSVPLPTMPAFYPPSKRSKISDDDEAEDEEAKAQDATGDSADIDAEEATLAEDDREDSASEYSLQEANESQDSAKAIGAEAGEEPSTLQKMAKMASDVAVAGVAAVAGTAAIKMTDEKQTEEPAEMDKEAESDDEKVEIMTSARVSVARSSSPAVSESMKPYSSKRSSSVGSARLIDLAGPKSPSASASRSPSVEAIERQRTVSVSRTSSFSSPSSGDDSRKTKPAPESVVTVTTPAAPSRSPIERVRPTLQSAATISESEEEADSVPALASKSKAHINFSKPTPPSTSHSEEASPNGISTYSPFKAPATKQAPMWQEPVAQGTKVTIIGKTNANGEFVEEKAPEVPLKSSGRKGSRPENLGAVSIERTRTKDSDDEPVLPLQSNASRPTHTSGSSASSGTGRHKAVRTSEEHVPSHAESVARNFEELIHSNQTITYTLTPENMRDIDAKHSLDSPIITKVTRKSEDARSPRSRSSSAAAEVKTAPIPTKPTPLASHPISEAGAVTSPAIRSPTRSSRLVNAQAREARVPGTDSTMDIADFIRSTGPSGEVKPTPGPVRNLQKAGSVSLPSKPIVDSRRVSASTAPRNRYQPRDAAVDNRADNSDLIDFIRQGPPSTMNNNPRIPRHVAPFRSTMDSEQMVGAVGGKATDASIPEIRNSQASTNITDSSMPSMPSMQSSANSSSALLKNRNQPAPTSNMFDEEDMMPKRKTRRVKDPYAIDFSDEEDDEFMLAPAAPPAKEESLADFLRNYEPPPSQKKPPPPKAPAKMPKKKASAPSLMGRFTRAYGRDNSSSTSNLVSANSDTRSLRSQTSTLGGGRGYIPIQVNLPAGYDRYGPIDTLPERSRTSTPSSMGKVPMKKFEPREAVTNTSKTSDLAAFLRDSGPPGDISGPMMRSGQAEESNSFSKVLARTKKALA